MPQQTAAPTAAGLGADFSSVRVHTGPEAGALGALAYAQGDDLHFGAGRFDPAASAGSALIGHELAHVVQQSAGRVPSGAPFAHYAD